MFWTWNHVTLTKVVSIATPTSLFGSFLLLQSSSLSDISFSLYFLSVSVSLSLTFSKSIYLPFFKSLSLSLSPSPSLSLSLSLSLNLQMIGSSTAKGSLFDIFEWSTLRGPNPSNSPEMSTSLPQLVGRKMSHYQDKADTGYSGHIPMVPTSEPIHSNPDPRVLIFENK